jgi:hypothetical protein
MEFKSSFNELKALKFQGISLKLQLNDFFLTYLNITFMRMKTKSTEQTAFGDAKCFIFTS